MSFTIKDSDLLAQLFFTLPERYDPLVTVMQNVEEDKLSINVAKKILLLEEASKSTEGKIKFILDYRACDHMVNENWYFQSLEKLDNPVVINVAKAGKSLVANTGG